MDGNAVLYPLCFVREPDKGFAQHVFTQMFFFFINVQLSKVTSEPLAMLISVLVYLKGQGKNTSGFSACG